MPPVKTKNKSKKKSTLPAKVSKHKKLKKNKVNTPKSQKLKRDNNVKKKKKLESEVTKQKKKKIIVKFPSKSVKAAKPKQKKVVKKKNQKSPKSLTKKQKMKSPDKGKITVSKRKRQNSESEVQVKMKKAKIISSPFNSSQITKPKEPVKMKMTQTETKDVSIKTDGMETTKQRYVTCFSCNVLVLEKDFHSHLFFGSIKCRFCLNPVQKCTDFANQMLKPNSYCPKSPMKMHGILQWDSCLHYVWHSVKKEITIRNFCNSIKTKPNEFEICCEISKYTNSLESLEQVEPWKSAFLELKAYCEQVFSQLKPQKCCFLKLFKGNKIKSDDKKSIFRTKDPVKNISLEASGDSVAPERKVLSQQNQETECATVSELHSSYVCANINGTSDSKKTESNEMKNIKQEEDLIKRRKHHQKFKKRDLKKIVRLPRDGRYLLVNYPNEQCPEECPECYSGFYPSNVTLFCTTGITKVVCEVLACYIHVPDFYEDARY
ncbi:LOW QUALITY PROTEIN: uncharacterized protein LOC119571141 [Penaeus monodon]|uniref:LOW QUALITY PROTEIN: uncharacterized protein LOC119571141 n=1 Tax=Penaeus monodon TaxID=6687 RepID=UPI0018A7ACCD|nr:LOW QUALITY PROTEIN: uncharacterized protein LOC119571141 [Penaeus monodon]